MSPDGGENATPDRVDMPKSSPIGGKAHPGPTLKSSGDVAGARPQYSSPTPDMRGRLFSHRPNRDGV
jgi:hypothetical protein